MDTDIGFVMKRNIERWFIVVLTMLSIMVGFQACENQSKAQAVLRGDVWKNPGLTKTWTPPTVTCNLVGDTATQTLTNKTIDCGLNTCSNIPAGGISGIVPIANGGTGQSTAPNAINALLPSQTGNSGKALTTNGTVTSWSAGVVGTVTSVVAGTGLTGGTITTSGTIALDVPVLVANGGTGRTVLTAGAIQYGAGVGGTTTSQLSPGTQYQVVQQSAGVSPVLDAVHLDQSAAVTGVLPITNGGTGSNSVAINTVFAGPASGSSGAPAFRALVIKDEPTGVVIARNSSATTYVATSHQVALVNCAPSSSVLAQLGTWASAITNNVSGKCSITIASGIFSGTPFCVTNVASGGVTSIATMVNPTGPTGVDVYGGSSGVPNTTGFALYITCDGTQ